MEYYTLIKVAHSLPALLLLLGMLAHVFMLFKAYRGGDAAVLARKLRVTRCYSLPALGVLALSLPVSGWWLAHLASIPLGQTWLLASSVLFVMLMVMAVLLRGRLAAWEALGETPASPRLLMMTAAYALQYIVLLLAIMGLMGAKPV